MKGSIVASAGRSKCFAEIARLAEIAGLLPSTNRVQDAERLKPGMFAYDGDLSGVCKADGSDQIPPYQLTDRLTAGKMS